MSDNMKDLFDRLLETVKFHCENNSVTYAEGLGIITIVKTQIMLGKALYNEKGLKDHFSRESKDLYFVLMSSIDSENIPEITGTLELLHDYLIQEYHHELNIEFPFDDDDDDDEDDEDE